MNAEFICRPLRSSLGAARAWGEAHKDADTPEPFGFCASWANRPDRRTGEQSDEQSAFRNCKSKHSRCPTWVKLSPGPLSGLSVHRLTGDMSGVAIERRVVRL